MKGNMPAYDSKQELASYQTLVGELVDLKHRINKATDPILHVIIQMGELKAMVTMLKSLNVKEGIIKGYNDSSEMVATINERERDKMMDETERAIEKLQDQLDHFNATTDL